MAYLLGSKFCIESLRNDVIDLQETVTDVLSRAGPVKCPSWKYPDKQALDVAVPELLQQHNYSDDEEERQVSHIVLLELVIDRLVLLLQGMSGYMDQILVLTRNTGSAAHGASSNSIGLAIKKYWNKVIHTNTVVQQLHSENKTKSRKILDLENTLKKLHMDQTNRRDSISDVPLSPEALELLAKSGLLETLGSPPGKVKDISEDEYTKATQTVETAFVPCESCHEVQMCLQQVGDAMSAICRAEGLPCSLVKYREQIEGLDWLSANDVSRWSAEQAKDLTRIQKHLRGLYEIIDPLKNQLTEAETKMKVAEENVTQFKKQMKLEKETMKTQQKQFNTKMEEVKQQSKQEVETVQREKNQIASGKQEVEKQLENLKVEMQKQISCLKELESVKVDLESQLEESRTGNRKVSELESQVMSLSEQLKDVNHELQTVNKELNKEKAKAKSFNRHQEAIQGKQEGLIEQLDKLDRENGELRETVAGLEEQQEQLQQQRDQLQQALDAASEATSQLLKHKELLKRMEKEKQELQDSVKEVQEAMQELRHQLQEAKERERLIIEYPDLNGPVNADLHGTGDIALDMENQIKANSIRIKLLEEQNASLRSTISKMLQSHVSQQVNGGPTQLWHSSPLSQPSPDRRDSGNEELFVYHSPPSANLPPRSPSPNKVLHNNFLVSPPPKSAGKQRIKSRPPSGNSQKSRPPSGSTQKATQDNSSIGAYVKLKNAGLLNKPNSAEMRYLLDRGKHPYNIDTEKTKATTSPTQDENYAPANVFICNKCDKMYNSMKDLQIHKSYCFGGL